jgi:hypothetical protein
VKSSEIPIISSILGKNYYFIEEPSKTLAGILFKFGISTDELEAISQDLESPITDMDIAEYISTTTKFSLYQLVFKEGNPIPEDPIIIKLQIKEREAASSIADFIVILYLPDGRVGLLSDNTDNTPIPYFTLAKQFSINKVLKKVKPIIYTNSEIPNKTQSLKSLEEKKEESREQPLTQSSEYSDDFNEYAESAKSAEYLDDFDKSVNAPESTLPKKKVEVKPPVIPPRTTSTKAPIVNPLEQKKIKVNPAALPLAAVNPSEQKQIEVKPPVIPPKTQITSIKTLIPKAATKAFVPEAVSESPPLAPFVQEKQKMGGASTAAVPKPISAPPPK